MIYLDYNATTPVDPRVAEAMMPFLFEQFGNAASVQHTYGQNAAVAIEAARGEVAGIFSADPDEVVFTSGATEACNLAIKGVYEAYQRKGRHIIVPATEHKAVLDCCNALKRRGADITILDVDSNGLVDIDALSSAIRQDTILVCMMWANNETGVIQDMDRIGEVCAAKGVMLFSDASQAAGKMALNPREAGIQLMAVSGHKIYGPKGIGMLYVSNRSPKVKLEPLIHGGGHEFGLRSGTLNVPGITGMAAALNILESERVQEAARLGAHRDKLELALISESGAVVNGETTSRLSHVTNVQFAGVKSSALMEALDGVVAMAAGSACTAADPSPSHVLKAMQLSTAEILSSVRLSVGRFTTAEDIDLAIKHINAACLAIRAGQQLPGTRAAKPI